MIAISLLGGVVLTAILLKIASSLLPDFEMDGMVPAFVAALIASVAGFAIQLPCRWSLLISQRKVRWFMPLDPGCRA